MNKSLTVPFAALMLAFTMPAGLVHAQSSNGVAAVVNGKVITKSEVRDVVKEQRTMIIMSVKDVSEQGRMLADLESQALYALIERELILSEFNKMGGQMKPAYIEDAINSLVRERFDGDREKFLVELSKTGMTIKKFREIQEKQMVVGYMRQRHMKDLAPPTPSQVEGYYRKHDDQFRDKDFIKMSTITVPKYPVGDASASPEAQRKLIEEIRGKITGGANFSQLAKTYSQDSRAESGGDWDWVERSVLDKSIAEAAFSLKVGGVSKVLDVGPSFMIIFCEAKKPGTLKKLDEVRPDIEKRIQSETGRAALGGWMRNLANKSMIQPDSVQKGFLDYIMKPDKQ